MSADPYRDPEQATTKRRIEAGERIASFEAKLAPLTLLVVPEDLRERIGRLRGLGEDASDDVRSELAESLEIALSTALEHEHDFRHLPDEHPEGPANHDSWGLMGTESAAASALMAVHAATYEVDRDAEITLTGPRITARLRVDGSPVLWSIHLGGEVTLGRSLEVHAFSTSSHWIETSVPKVVPS